MRAEGASTASTVAGSSRAGWFIVTAVAAAIVFPLGQFVLWRSPAGSPVPPATVLPFFVFLEAVTSVVFGFGVAFVIYGYGLLARARQPLWLTYATYVAISWTMVSWWPHGNLHRITPAGQWNQLLFIDYSFHLTLMASAVVISLFFLRVLRATTSRG